MEMDSKIHKAILSIRAYNQLFVRRNAARTHQKGRRSQFEEYHRDPERNELTRCRSVTGKDLDLLEVSMTFFESIMIRRRLTTR